MSATRMTAILLLASAAWLASGCSDETIDHSASDGSASDSNSSDSNSSDGGSPADTTTSDSEPAADSDSGATNDGGGHLLRIFVAGDTSPRSFTDGAAGQTPKRYIMGLGRFEIMTRIDDPSPFLVFDHGDTPRQIDLLAKQPTLAGEIAIEDLQGASYTHGRVLLTTAEATVDATVHLGLAVPGELTVTGALSDTTIDGKPRKQNEATFRFSVGGVSQSVPGVLPPLPTTAGGAIVQEDGKTWMIFPFLTPMKLSPATARDHTATITYQLFESFRWTDEQQAGYKPGVFDVDAGGGSFEPVINFGATDYSVTTD